MEQWKNFNFSKQELQKSLNIDDSESYKDDLFHRTLVVNLWTNTTYNAKAFKQTTIQSWRLKNPVEVQDLKQNLYLFRFSTKNDADNVFNNGPWSFDKKLIVLRKITGEEQPEEDFDMDKVLFWVRVYDLPLKLRSDSIAKKIGDVIGVYVGTDQCDVYRMGIFLRIRVLLDLKMPLVRGTLVCYKGRNIRVFFRYERLQTFCFICGRIGHQMKACDENEGCEEVEEKEYSFGQWLRASPPSKINYEEKKDRSSSSCRKSLFVEDLETRKVEGVVMEQNIGLIVDEVEAYKDGLLCRTLAVKLWTNTTYNAKAFKQTTIQSWKLKNPVEVQDLNKNLYLFRFSTKKDAENVLKNGPWSFDKNLIVLQKITGEEQPAEFDMHKVSFWVRIYDLPLQLRSDSIAKKIGDFIGVHEETDQREIYRMESFLRIRVLMDLKKPLMRGTVVCYQGRSLRVFFKYERLPTFCFNCGRIGHQKKTCEDNEEEEEGFEEVEEKQYSFGPWLRASPPPKINCEEDSNSSSCRKSLFACPSNSIVEESEPIKGKEVKVEQNKGNAKSKEQCLDFEESGKKLTNKEVNNIAESLERVTLKNHDYEEAYP
jgi:hypothetical protein